MQIIAILLATDEEGKPFVQAISSDGIDPEEGARACRRAMDAFRSAAIEAEVKRRVEAAQSETEPPASSEK